MNSAEHWGHRGNKIIRVPGLKFYNSLEKTDGRQDHRGCEAGTNAVMKVQGPVIKNSWSQEGRATS